MARIIETGNGREVGVLTMEMQYIRKPRASYMVLVEEKEPREWEGQMMGHAPDGNILFAKRVQENGEHYLWYEITAKQSLDVLLDAETLKYPLLCDILLGIYEAVEFLEGILLEAEALLLLPEGIFVDYRTGKVCFCYYPGNEKGLQDAFRELLEGLLTHLDHEDERAVGLAYGIYEDVSKGGMCLADIKRLLRLPYEKEEADGQAEQADETEEKTACLDGLDDRERQAFSQKQKPAQENLPEENLPEEDLWKTGKSEKTLRKAEKTRRKAGKPEVEKQIRENIRDVLDSIRGFFSGKNFRVQKAKAVKEEEVFFFEPEEEETPKSAHPTVLLTELTRPPEGILRYEGRGPCKDIAIEGDSFVIGSGEDCEGYIPSTTVSRRHARISKKEGIYFIEDMNSSNGTYVGGEMLNYKTRMSLQKNEIVIFADEKFRFI